MIDKTKWKCSGYKYIWAEMRMFLITEKVRL